jgi:hypothetical protein
VSPEELAEASYEQALAAFGHVTEGYDPQFRQTAMGVGESNATITYLKYMRGWQDVDIRKERGYGKPEVVDHFSTNNLAGYGIGVSEVGGVSDDDETMDWTIGGVQAFHPDNTPRALINNSPEPTPYFPDAEITHRNANGLDPGTPRFILYEIIDGYLYETIAFRDCADGNPTYSVRRDKAYYRNRNTTDNNSTYAVRQDSVEFTRVVSEVSDTIQGAALKRAIIAAEEANRADNTERAEQIAIAAQNFETAISGQK